MPNMTAMRTTGGKAPTEENHGTDSRGRRFIRSIGRTRCSLSNTCAGAQQFMQTTNETKHDPIASSDSAAANICFAVDQQNSKKHAFKDLTSAVNQQSSNGHAFKELTIRTLIVAVYLRYSDDQQKATSIDDQLRMCHETLARNGITS